MIELPIEVTPDGGDPIRVVATSRDFRMWEKVTKGFSFSKDMQAGLSMTDAYGIAYHACRRNKIFTGSLADFEAQHDLDILGDEAEDVDPTPAAP